MGTRGQGAGAPAWAAGTQPASAVAVHRRAAPARPARCHRRPAPAAVRRGVPSRRRCRTRRAGQGGGPAMPDAGDPVGGRRGRAPRGVGRRGRPPPGWTPHAGSRAETLAAAGGADYQLRPFYGRHAPGSYDGGGRGVPVAGAADPEPPRRPGARRCALGRAGPACACPACRWPKHGAGRRGRAHGAPPAALVPRRRGDRGVDGGGRQPPLLPGALVAETPQCSAIAIIRDIRRLRQAGWPGNSVFRPGCPCP